MLIGDVKILAQTFQETIGAAGLDEAERIIQTTGGEYVAVGSSNSFGGGDYDIVLTGLDGNGVEQWTRRYYGPLDEFGNDVQEVDRDGDGTPDGYAIVGTSNSSGNGDIYLILTDLNGLLVSTRTYGGSGREEGYSVVQMTDYGYLLCGMTTSYGRPYSAATDMITGNVFVVRTDINLDPQWSTVISSDELTPDYGYSAIETLAGEIMLTGTLGGFGAGGKDIAVINLDQNGALQWSQSYGSPDDDAGYEIREVISGGVSTGFIIAATVEGLGTGGSDASLLRLDPAGGFLWHSIFGGVNNDEGHSVAFTPSGGFALCGLTRSFGFGSFDVYVVETDAGGAYLQSFVYGGTGQDAGNSIRAATGGYIIGGLTGSFGAGIRDEYIIKTDGVFATPCNYQAVVSDYTPGPSENAGSPPWAIIHMACTGEIDTDAAVTLDEDVLCSSCTCSPSPSGYQHSYGAGGWVLGHNISEMSSTDLLIAGESNTYTGNQDVYIAKTDATGNLLWSRVIWPGGANPDNEYAVAALEMPSGELFVAGTTDDGTDRQVYVVVLSSSGVPTSISYTFNPLSGTSDAQAVDAQPIVDNSGNVTGFMVLARLTDYNTGADVYLLEFDSGGNFVNGTILDQSLMIEYHPHSLAPIDSDGDGIKDDGWVIAGLVTDVGIEAAVVIQVDASLAIAWKNGYVLAPVSDHAYGMDIVQIDSDGDGKQDDEYALSGPVDAGGGFAESFIALIDQSGGVVGGTATRYKSTSAPVISYAITQTCDNDLVVTGEYNNRTWQLRTDVALNTLCATAYANDGQGEELLQTSDQGIAIVGYEYNTGLSSYEAWLVKTNCDCSAGCYETPLTLTQTTDMLTPYTFSMTDIPMNTYSTPNSYSAAFFDETTVCVSPLVVLPEESTPLNEYMEMDSQLDKIEPSNSDSATDVDDETLNGAMLEIYPNPVQNGTQLNVTFNSRTSALVSVKVTNVLGAVIGEYPLNASPGEQSLQLDTQDWTPGTYTLTLNSSAGASASSIVVVVR